jgi:hypothetical protein
VTSSVQSNQGGSIFVAKFPERTQTIETVRVVEEPRITVTNQIQEVVSDEQEEIRQPIATTFRPPQLIQVNRPPQILVSSGDQNVRAQVISGAYRERPAVQTVQTFTSQPQIQRFTVQQPSRIRVIPIQRPEIKVNEIVEQVRIPQQQQIRIIQEQPQQVIVQQRPQQLFVQQGDSNEIVGQTETDNTQQGLRTRIIGVRPGALNLG